MVIVSAIWEKSKLIETRTHVKQLPLTSMAFQSHRTMKVLGIPVY